LISQDEKGENEKIWVLSGSLSENLLLKLGGANAIFLRCNPDTGTIRYRNGAM
jgi:hypothetical protein